MANAIKRLHRRLRTGELGPNTSMREPGDRTAWALPLHEGEVGGYLVRIDSLAAQCDRDSTAERWFNVDLCINDRYEVNPTGPESWEWRTSTFDRDIEPYLDLADAYGPLTPADSKWVDYVFAEVEHMGGVKEWNRW